VRWVLLASIASTAVKHRLATNPGLQGLHPGTGFACATEGQFAVAVTKEERTLQGRIQKRWPLLSLFRDLRQRVAALRTFSAFHAHGQQ
jgi:hypothetical protein